MRRRGRLSPEAVAVFGLASTLVQQDVRDDEAVVRLSAVPGGREALQETARYVGGLLTNGYPATRIHRLLLAAVDQPVPALTEQEACVESRQRQLSEQPPSVTFGQLAEQVPALRELEQRARTDPKSFLRELSPLEHLLGGPGGQAAQQFRITVGMKKAVQRLVGPSAGLSDPVLSSPAAVSSANRYLWRVAGIDPRSWGPSGR
jgi:hypothetical protein